MKKRVVLTHSLPDDKMLDWSKLKAFADDVLNLAEMMVIIHKSLENLVGKGENAGYQHFPHFPRGFQRAFYTGSFNLGIVR